ncbi:hypothetical protein MASR2M78_18300 [Treponema sp.]
MKNIIVGTLLLSLTIGFAVAQTTPDPAMQEAKKKLEVVYDLGRVFGFIQTMDKEQKKLALSAAQAKSLLTIAEKILEAKRIEPKTADVWLGEIEDKILKPDQLMFVDGLFMARTSSSSAGNGTGAGASGGTSPIQSYVSGGPFNPMLDTSKTLGKDFKAAYEYLKAKK